MTETTPLYTLSYPAGYYALENTVTGRIIRTPYNTCDVKEEFIREKYKNAFLSRVPSRLTNSVANVSRNDITATIMTETKIEIGQTYQLAPIAPEQRKDGVIYLSPTLTFKLIAIDGTEAWVRCNTLGSSFVVKVDRLRHY